MPTVAILCQTGLTRLNGRGNYFIRVDVIVSLSTRDKLSLLMETSKSRAVRIARLCAGLRAKDACGEDDDNGASGA